MFGGTGSNRDVRPENLSHRRHREEKVGPSSPSWPVPHKPKREQESWTRSWCESAAGSRWSPATYPHIGLLIPLRSLS